MIYGFRRMKTVGIDPDRATDAVIGGLIGAIFGARFYYIIFNTEGMKFSEFSIFVTEVLLSTADLSVRYL